MSKTEKYLILQEELKRLTPALVQARDIIRDQDVSNYPIFIAHQSDIHMGIPVIDKEETGDLWNVNASTLEEFVTKNVVKEDHIEKFREVYNSKNNHVCVFVLSELGADFIYLDIH